MPLTPTTTSGKATTTFRRALVEEWIRTEDALSIEMLKSEGHPSALLFTVLAISITLSLSKWWSPIHSAIGLESVVLPTVLTAMAAVTTLLSWRWVCLDSMVRARLIQIPDFILWGMVPVAAAYSCSTTMGVACALIVHGLMALHWATIFQGSWTLRCAAMLTWAPLFALAGVYGWVAPLGIVTMFVFLIVNQTSNLRRAVLEQREQQRRAEECRAEECRAEERRAEEERRRREADARTNRIIEEVNSAAYAEGYGGGRKHAKAEKDARDRRLAAELVPDVLFSDFFDEEVVDWETSLGLFAGARFVAAKIDLSPREGICSPGSLCDLIIGLDADARIIMQCPEDAALAVPEIVLCSIVDALITAARQAGGSVAVNMWTVDAGVCLRFVATGPGDWIFDIDADAVPTPGAIAGLTAAGGELRYDDRGVTLECPTGRSA